jgi:uncharacterized glyoxalase superfamily protein PhnB
MTVKFGEMVPYLHYEDAGAMLEWLSRVFGFEERARYIDKEGVVRQAEMLVGDHELWFSGHDEGLWDQKSGRPDRWVGVWVDDVDAMYERVRAAGIETDPPKDQDYDVRNLNIVDPEGVMWGFMKRLGTGYIQRRSVDEGGLEEILPS